MRYGVLVHVVVLAFYTCIHVHVHVLVGGVLCAVDDIPILPRLPYGTCVSVQAVVGI